MSRYHPNKYYQCTICNRLFTHPMPHKCRGNFRKRNIKWKFLAKNLFNDSLQGVQKYVLDIINTITEKLNQSGNKESSYDLVFVDRDGMIISKYNVCYTDTYWDFTPWESYTKVDFDKILYDIENTTVENINKILSTDSYYLIDKDGMTNGLTKLF